MISYIVLAALMISSQTSWAHKKAPVEELPASRRIEFVDYREGTIYPLLGVINHPFVIEFTKGETILEVAGGGIAGWDVQRRTSRLFVRSLPEAKLATMLVVTDAYSYVFDLVPAKQSPQTLAVRRSRFVFNAPAQVDPVVTLPAAVPMIVDKPVEKLVEKPVDRATAPIESRAEPVKAKTAFNRNYSMQIVKEDVIIHPKEVFDDGVFTWFLFPQSQAIPVLYKSVPGTTEESVVNFHMEGDYLVAHSIAALWNLRLGSSLVGVFNESFNPTGLSGKAR